mgnify:CR=1 FL=1
MTSPLALDAPAGAFDALPPTAFAPVAEAPAALHWRLANFNRRRLLPALPGPHWRSELADEIAARTEEREFLDAERRAVAEQALQAPLRADAFVAWFEALRQTGPGQGDPLFPWLAQHATLHQMRWFIAQEAAGEAGFDDLVALAQLRLPVRPKLEMARNYWDEMGRGKEVGMHGPMLALTAQELDIAPRIETTVWESLALANLMLGLAASRAHAYHAIGALGAIELTAPTRVGLVGEGLRRLGVSSAGRRYFHLHASIDVAHSAAWNSEVIAPLVAAEPRCARAIAEGALMRLAAGARCFARYRREFGLDGSGQAERGPGLVPGGCHHALIHCAATALAP